jgi:uncharacterized protein
MVRRKIINDPVYGFITIDHPLIFKVISHPSYQRLRRIHQMAMAHLVYPGAVHSRLHHSLGAYHLMSNALSELQAKKFEITEHEAVSAKIAILLHDLGHGPYSHALEKVLIKGVSHEDISLLMMRKMNEEMNGELQLAVDIFTNKYHKKFLHQLVSGQLDVDRMDYLTRDSFFTGVSEGVIGYDRILKMLTVHNGELMIEEKGIYSIEKFLVARRLMYWQVYLHKTVLAAEKMLVNIIVRAKEVGATGVSKALDHFLHRKQENESMECCLVEFCNLDDYDVLHAIKEWAEHQDKVLSMLCNMLLDRRLLKVKYYTQEVDDALVEEKRKATARHFQLSDDEVSYLVFKGVAENSTYNSEDERINIVFKDGTVTDISSVDNALIHQTLSGSVKKFYICYPELKDI